MQIYNFICERCLHPGKHKACPVCNIPIVKESGCDHMTCLVEYKGCGIHWCYRCDNDVFHSHDATDIYDHLFDTHGNIWGAPDD